MILLMSELEMQRSGKVLHSHESPSFDLKKKKKIHRLEALQVVQEHMTHFTAPSFFSSFLPLESSPFFFFEDISLPLPGLPEPIIGDGGDPEWR